MRLNVIFLILTCAISIASQPTAAASGCRKGAGPSHFEPKLDVIRQNVASALSSGNQKELLGLAACDFLIGKPESDSGAFNAPAVVMPLIAKSAKTTKWKTKELDYGTQVNVEADSPELSHQLVFRKETGKGWYWAGFLTYDSGLEEKLERGSYSLGSEHTKDDD